MSTGKLIVISAPSGTGKTTICKRLLKIKISVFGRLAFKALVLITTEIFRVNSIGAAC